MVRVSARRSRGRVLRGRGSRGCFLWAGSTVARASSSGGGGVCTSRSWGVVDSGLALTQDCRVAARVGPPRVHSVGTTAWPRPDAPTGPDRRPQYTPGGPPGPAMIRAGWCEQRVVRLTLTPGSWVAPDLPVDAGFSAPVDVYGTVRARHHAHPKIDRSTRDLADHPAPPIVEGSVLLARVQHLRPSRRAGDLALWYSDPDRPDHSDHGLPGRVRRRALLPLPQDHRPSQRLPPPATTDPHDLATPARPGPHRTVPGPPPTSPTRSCPGRPTSTTQHTHNPVKTRVGPRWGPQAAVVDPTFVNRLLACGPRYGPSRTSGTVS